MRDSTKTLLSIMLIYYILTIASGCSVREKVVYVKEYVEVKNTIPIVSRPVDPMVRKVNLKVTNGKITLSAKDYDSLVFNMLEVLRYKQDTDSILRFYEYKIGNN